MREKRKVISTRQELLWLGGWTRRSGIGHKLADPVPFEGQQPTRVWTLYRHTDPDHKPPLPYSPTHNVNAFMEDVIHNWSVSQGMFRYRSRVCEDPVWLLLEWDIYE
jgi:hypothetical protein